MTSSEPFPASHERPLKDGIQTKLGNILGAGSSTEINMHTAPVITKRELGGHVGERIKIVSVQPGTGRYRNEPVAIAGIEYDETGLKRITLGGTLGQYLLSIETYKLPVWKVLREAGISRYGETLYNWESA